MLEVVNLTLDEGLADLRSDVFESISTWPGLSVEVSENSSTSSCSVFGSYLPSTGASGAELARIRIVRASSARMRFTALHELGHHLQQTSGPAVQALSLQADGGAYLEELASDSFAAEVLLPKRLIDSFLDDGNPSAVSLERLWSSQGGEVSRAAVCVAGGSRLQTDGIVGVLNSDGVVQFSSSRALPRLRRGSDQSQSALFGEIAKTRSNVVHTQTRFEYRDGIRGQELWSQAVRTHGDYWMFVAASQSVPWRTIALPSLAPAVVGRWWNCELCDHTWQSFSPVHDACGAPVCVECDRCACALARATRQCSSCFLNVKTELFTSDSDVCVDCRS